MDVFEAIRTRRSLGRIKPDPVPRELVERLIEAATWAPNHHRTEPWRFFIFAGEARAALGRALADALRTELEDPHHPDGEALLEKERAKPLRAPVVIVVAAVPSEDPWVVEVEEIEACAAAVQNLLLAAHALGLAAIWRTGDSAYRRGLKTFLGLRDRDHVIGFVYAGYPDAPLPEGRRTPASEKARWFGW